MPPDRVTQRVQVPVQGLTHARILTAFEALRRSLAHSVGGSEGAFAGLTGSTFGRSRTRQRAR